MTSSRILLSLCLSFVGGIFISSMLGFLPGSREILLLPGLILAILLISVFWKYKKLVVIGFCLIFLVLGVWRYQLAEAKILNSKLRDFNDEEEIVTLVGTVIEEPDVRDKIVRLKIKIDSINNLKIKEKILVTAQRYPEYQYGDELKIAGQLKSPSQLEGFNYKDYLAKEGIYSVMDFPEIKLINKNQGSLFYKTLLSFKNKLKESLNRVISRPQSAILEALFFGDEQNISKDLKEKFNLTGTRHLTAVSGMNITILTFLILNFLLMLGFWRQQAFYLSIILIIFYISMIGAPASAIRAGIMAILFLIAQNFGRASTASRTVVIAATFMLLENPLLLRFDIGFQLSFLAMMGLVYLQPIFSDLFGKIPNTLQLRNNLAATLSAQIFTFPILIYNFGQISIISPITNILILPLIPFLTILGFIFSFVGIFWQFLGQILSWPAYLMISYIIKAIDFFSKISWASLSFKNVHWLFLVISYLILGLITWRLQEKQKLRFLKY